MSYWYNLFQKGIANSNQKPANGIEIFITGTNMKKKHKFSHTMIEHHGDGTHTIHHINEKHGHQHVAPEREGDVKGAAGDHDAMMDHMMEHTSAPNPGEQNDVAGAALAAPAAAAPPAGA